MRTIEEVIAELRNDIHSDVYLGKKTINTYLDEILEIHKAERPHGEWIVDEEHSITITMYKCTNCGYFGGGLYYNYCPQCGADMRGEEK